jgi:rubrerythrin
MKKERAAYELYSDMAEKVPESHLRQVFVGLAKEEAKHKLFFESEYDERVLQDN